MHALRKAGHASTDYGEPFIWSAQRADKPGILQDVYTLVLHARSFSAMQVRP